MNEHRRIKRNSNIKKLPLNCRIDGSGEIEESPDASEDELDEKPRNDVELLADVHQIEEEK